MSVRERLGLEHPIVGAGLGGGLSRARLTVAIAEAGGLGQIGIMPPPLLRAELAAHRERSTGPVAVNLLLPFARRGHWEVARRRRRGRDVLGRPRRVRRRRLGAPVRVGGGGSGRGARPAPTA